MYKNYESPKIEFKNLNLKETIADKCWGWADKKNQPNLYYDIEGTGWVVFKVTGGDCVLNNADEITIVEFKNTNITKQEFYEELCKAGGNSGNPWNGTKYSETGPGDNWS